MQEAAFGVDRELLGSGPKSQPFPLDGAWDCPAPPLDIAPPVGLYGSESIWSWVGVGEQGRWDSRVTSWDNSPPNPHQVREVEEEEHESDSGSQRVPPSLLVLMDCWKAVAESLALSSLSCWLWYKAANTDIHTCTTPPYNTHTGHPFWATRFRFWKTLLVKELMAEEFKTFREKRVRRRKVRNELEKTLVMVFMFKKEPNLRAY